MITLNRSNYSAWAEQWLILSLEYGEARSTMLGTSTSEDNNSEQDQPFSINNKISKSHISQDMDSEKLRYVGKLMVAIINSISEECKYLLNLSESYRIAINSFNIKVMWDIIKDKFNISIIDINEQKKMLWTTKQHSQSLGKYLDNINYRKNLITQAGGEISDEDSLGIFLGGLSDAYSGIVRDWRISNNMPESTEEAINRLLRAEEFDMMAKISANRRGNRDNSNLKDESYLINQNKIKYEPPFNSNYTSPHLNRHRSINHHSQQNPHRYNKYDMNNQSNSSINNNNYSYNNNNSYHRFNNNNSSANNWRAVNANIRNNNNTTSYKNSNNNNNNINNTNNTRRNIINSNINQSTYHVEHRSKCAYCEQNGHSAQECNQLSQDKSNRNNTSLAAIILDTGSTIHVVNNRKLLEKLRPTTVKIKGVSGSQETATEEGEIPNIGKAVIMEKSPENLISHQQLLDNGFDISYGNQTFTARRGQYVIEFKLDPIKRLYTNYTLLSSTNGAKEARKIHEALGHPSDSTMKKAIDQQIISIITKEDVDEATRQLGRCESCIQAKSTEPAAPAREKNTDISPGESIHTDIVFVGKKKHKKTILFSVDEASGYVMSICLKNKKKDTVLGALTQQINQLKAFGHTVKKIQCDEESAIIGAESQINQLEIMVTTASPYRHDKMVERYVRTLKERIRAIMIANRVDIDLLPYAINFATQAMNLMPNARSPKSPEYTIKGTVPQIRQLKYSFGQRGYIHVHQSEREDDLEPRAHKATFLGSFDHSRGYLVYDEDEDRVAYRHEFIEGREMPEDNQSQLDFYDEIMMPDDVEDVNEDDEDYDPDVALITTMSIAPQEKVNQAIDHELTSLFNLGVIEPIHWSVIETTEKNIVNSYLIIRDKLNSDGTYNKTKARLVANGKAQSSATFDECYASTVDKKHMMATLIVARQRKWKIATTDIPSAYLHAYLDREIYIKLDRKTSTRLIKMDSRFQELLKNGCILARLHKSIYGLKQSGNLWQKELQNTLTGLGLTRITTEPCGFYSNQCIIVFHVDDLLIAYDNEETLALIEKALQKYGKIEMCTSNIHQYLGMKIMINEDSVSLIQDGIIQRLNEDFQEVKESEYPASLEILNTDDNKEEVDKKLYLSTVMRLMYIAKSTRPDILFATTTLAARAAQPKKRDWDHVLKIVGYLKKTKELELRIRNTSGVSAYADASYNLHKDSKGHSGFIIWYGGAIFCRSTKQKMNTRSSTESEILAVYDNIPYLLELKIFLEEIGSKETHTSVYQDNQSTIKLIENGHGTNGRTKHMNAKIYYLKDNIDNGNIKLEYLSTNNMVADILTKPIVGSKFKELRDILMGHIPPA